MESLATQQLIRCAVCRIAGNGPPSGSEVHAKLMRASGEQVALHERIPIAAGHRRVPRVAWCTCGIDDDLATVRRIAAQRQRNAAVHWLRRPADDREVLLFNATGVRIALNLRVHTW